MIARYAGGERGARSAARSGSAVVVVDAFRASTTIAVLVSKGVRVVPVASIEQAYAYAGADFRIGERGSARVAGFDFGNSPTEVLGADVSSGSTVALSSTNGTRIVEAALGAPDILTGAFVNAGALAEELSSGGYGDEVVVVGCGWEGRRASEDEAAAGAILHRLRARGAELDDRAVRVVEGYLSRPAAVLKTNSAARRLKRLGYERDLAFCLAEDTVPVAARLADGAFAGAVRGPPDPVNLRPEGQHKKPDFVLDREVARLYPGVSEGGSNVTSSVESATGRR
ncbi:MAG: 2-phosphosulfolactate phosphatase [Rubrobacter sp.]